MATSPNPSSDHVVPMSPHGHRPMVQKSTFFSFPTVQRNNSTITTPFGAASIEKALRYRDLTCPRFRCAANAAKIALAVIAFCAPCAAMTKGTIQSTCGTSRWTTSSATDSEQCSTSNSWSVLACFAELHARVRFQRIILQILQFTADAVHLRSAS